MPPAPTLEIYPLTLIEWVTDRLGLPALLLLARAAAAVSRRNGPRSLATRLDGLLKRHGRGGAVVPEAAAPSRLRADLGTAWSLLLRDWAALRGGRGENSFNLLHRVWKKCRMKWCGAP